MRSVLIFLVAVAFVAACAPVEPAMNDTEVLVELPPEEPEVPEEPEPPEEPEEEPTAKFTVEGTEGDLIVLRPKAVDPDDDNLEYSFTDPFDDNGEWQTQLGDEGTYFVAVTADDSKGGRTTETVRVFINRANRPPVIDCTPVTISEGDFVDLHDHCTVTDEDDEEVIVTYSGWMTSWRYQTTYDDAGTHTVTITASDRRKNEVLHTVKEDVRVVVRDTNRPPVFSEDFPAVIAADEQDVITLPRDLIEDPDGDSVRITFSDPFDSTGTWKTELGDAGVYDVDVVASDGETTEKRTVRIEIALLNTAPVLQPIGDITVDEGETIELPISATDREGDSLTILVSGWMNSDTYETNYEDAGTYTVKVTASDGQFTDEEVVEITVRDRNRPPVFVTPA